MSFYRVIIVLSCFVLSCNPKLLPGQEPQPVIALNQLADHVFSVAIFNASAKDISIGRLDSQLGFDQIQFDVKTKASSFTIKRRNIIIGSDQLTPIMVRSGGYAEIKVDLGDGSWAVSPKGFPKKALSNDWEWIKVIYGREHISTKKYRREKKLYAGEFEGIWSQVHQPYNLFLKNERNRRLQSILSKKKVQQPAG